MANMNLFMVALAIGCVFVEARPKSRDPEVRRILKDIEQNIKGLKGELARRRDEALEKDETTKVLGAAEIDLDRLVSDARHGKKRDKENTKLTDGDVGDKHPGGKLKHKKHGKKGKKIVELTKDADEENTKLTDGAVGDKHHGGKPKQKKHYKKGKKIVELTKDAGDEENTKLTDGDVGAKPHGRKGPKSKKDSKSVKGNKVVMLEANDDDDDDEVDDDFDEDDYDDDDDDEEFDDDYDEDDEDGDDDEDDEDDKKEVKEEVISDAKKRSMRKKLESVVGMLDEMEDSLFK